MYILKNALRSISRAKVRNVLIGVIVLVIAISSCVALSIREVANSAKEKYLEEMEVTAQISIDRQSMMKDFSSREPGQFDRDSMKEMLTNQKELTLDEMEIYAKADSVKGFYYTGSTSVNADENWEAVDTTGRTEEETDTESDTSGFPGMGGNGGMGGMFGGGMMPGRMGNQGDATVVGYSADEAMAEFLAGTSTITDGEMFEEGTEEYNCVISDELATYNELEVGDTIVIVNPNNEEESYELTIVGLYHNDQSGMSQPGMMGGFSTATDSANQIYMSYNALAKIIKASEEMAANAEAEDDDTDVSGKKFKNKKKIAMELLQKVGLDEDEANRRILKLSGGQQQRVAIARALSYDPEIILADEPTGNLDGETQNDIMEIFAKLAKEENKCVIIVTHSPEVTEKADIVYELKKSR